MIKDIVVIDNALDNPYELIEFANKQKFYGLENHCDSNCPDVKWCGNRTDEIIGYNFDYINQINEKLLTKVLFQDQPLYRTDSNYGFRLDWRANSYFHRLEEKDVYDETWIHNDLCIFASILYLSPDSDPKLGTKIFKPGKEIIVENTFNRFLLYRADYLHTALGGFGKQETARLTFVSFYTHLKFNIFKKSPEEKEILT